MEGKIMVQNLTAIFRLLTYSTCKAAMMQQPCNISNYLTEELARRAGDDAIAAGNACMYDIEICRL